MTVKNEVNVTYAVKVPYAHNNYRQLARFVTLEDAKKQLDLCIKGSYIVKQSFEIVATKE